MEIIGYDDNWALVCPKCSAIIHYRSDDIKVEDIKNGTGGTWHIAGLHCPACSQFLPEKNRRKIIYRGHLNDTSYYFAAADDKVIIV